MSRIFPQYPRHVTEADTLSRDSAVIGQGSRLLLLDRDGVINQESPDYIKSPDEWRPIPGSLAAIARLASAGFRVAVTTNQSGVGRGLFSEEVLGDIHRKMLSEVEQAGGRIDRIFYCPHGPDEGCDCRKPRPGLIYQAIEALPCQRSNIVLIGDTLRDLEAAQAADIQAFLVRTGKGAATEKDLPQGLAAGVYDDLAAAANALLGEATGA